ncbi:MAG: PorV/PorQ family protein [Candidatus Marinimicrobia bacterium]|nr:PorV/PorQ family protein [Candidatus Neomarinimicrobiota bacterium]
MKKLISVFLFIILTNIFFLDSVFPYWYEFEGVGMKKVGQASMTFLQVGVIPNAVAMGEAYTSIGTGCESIFYNPSGLGEMTSRMSLLLSGVQYVADIKYTTAAIAFNLGNFGALGLHLVNVNYGEIVWTGLAVSPADVKGYREFGKLNNVSSYSYGVSYSRKISAKFLMGATIKYVGQNLGQSRFSYIEVVDGDTTLSDVDHKNSESVFAYDMGVKFYPGFKSFRFGMYIRNFASSIKYEEITTQLPMTFAVGCGMNLFDFFNIDPKKGSLFASIEFTHPNNYTERLHIGLKFSYMNVFSAMCGYVTNKDEEGFSAGFSISPQVGGRTMEISYSYTPLKIFNTINRFSIKISL